MRTPSERIRTLPWRVEGACPCCSGKLLRDCCLTPSGDLRKRYGSVRPSGDQTGRAHTGCYLSPTKNCCSTLSAEHYISRNALEEFGSRISVSGFPWSGSDPKLISVASLTSKILCKRHNNALSALDTEGGHFFRSLRPIERDLNRRSLSRKPCFYFVSGEAVELWMLKTLAGMYYARAASSQGSILAENSSFAVNLLVQALQGLTWERGCGLYIRAITNESAPAENAIGFAPLTNPSDGRVVGCLMRLVGLEFMTILDPAGANFEQIVRSYVFRPTNLVFENETRAHVVVLTWGAGTNPFKVTIAWNRLRRNQ